MRKTIMIIAVAIWLLALLGTLIYRGNTLANIILLVVSVGMIVVGLVLSRQNQQ
jgi:hypothetical protein